MAEETRSHTPPPKDLLLSLTNCHSCGRHSPAKPSQTLTGLQTLDSQWRIVLLCEDCLCLVQSAANCSYCFAGIGGDPSLACRHCDLRVHVCCVPRLRRFLSPSDLDPDSFTCVDCCPLQLPHSNPRFSFSRVTVEGLLDEAKRKGLVAAIAKEKAVQKVLVAKAAADRAKEALVAVTRPVVPIGSDVVVNDEELALQLHLAMNGSRRTKRGTGSARICMKVELCGEDKGFFDSWVEPKKEGLHEDNNGSSSREGKSIDSLLKYCRRSKGGSLLKSCRRSANSNTGNSLLKYCRRRAKSSNGSTALSKNGGEDTLDRYLMKYRRKSGLKAMLKREENRQVPC